MPTDDPAKLSDLNSKLHLPRELALRLIEEIERGTEPGGKESKPA